MRYTTLFYFINFIYMEFMLHLYFFKDVGLFWIPGVVLALVISLVQSMLVGLTRNRANRILFFGFLGLDYLLFGSQMVYRFIFKQPLLFDAVRYGGQDALTNYWREALQGIVNSGLGLMALALGVVWVVVVVCLGRAEPSVHTAKERLMHVAVLAGAFLALGGAIFGLYKLAPERYMDYQEFGYPDEVLEEYGELAMLARDLDLLYLPEYEEEIVIPPSEENEESTEQTESTEHTEQTQESDLSHADGNGASDTGATQESGASKELVYKPQVLDVNVDYLKEIGSDDVDKVTDYVMAMEPTMSNEYTGLFEGYNLIYITAEGFSSAAIDADLTPTLYQLTHSGVVVPEYYVPLWQTSTSDGEYVNLTGLIPDQQFSMTRSSENAQPFSLASYFREEGASCFAYHNNTLDYYDRHLSHPNLGYDFKASKLGNLEEAEWGEHIFQMANPKYWPSSDLEMIQATLPEYVHEERFHVYYMTVSGHMNYNFLGNKMSWLHREAVSDLPYSEEGRAYIACNMELDRALAYLIQELHAAGKLENTVICLSSDHYPYGMNPDNYEELMGMELEDSLDIYRNSLILWNSRMEKVVVDKPCSALDLAPTLMNLFGFEYDSRLFSGRDIFSDSAPLVVFANRSFITDVASYNKKTGEVLSRTGEPVSQEYVDSMKSYVRMLHKHSAGILNHDYYAYFRQACQ